MRIITEADLMERLVTAAQNGTLDAQTDNLGQVVIYTGWFEWIDGTLRDEPDPSFRDGPSEG